MAGPVLPWRMNATLKAASEASFIAADGSAQKQLREAAAPPWARLTAALGCSTLNVGGFGIGFFTHRARDDPRPRRASERVP